MYTSLGPRWARGKSARRLAISAALLLFLPQALFAQQTRDEASAEEQEPLVTDRPDFTESAETVAPGRIQIEAGYTFEKSDDVDVQSVGEMLLRIGALDNLEFRVVIPSYVRVEEPVGAAGRLETDGVDDATLGLKLKLVDSNPQAPAVPDLAILLATTIPTASNGLGSDEVQPGAVIAAGWDLSDRVSLGSNLGYGYLAEDDTGLLEGADGGTRRFSEFSSSVAVGIGIAGGLGSYVEYFGLYPTGDGTAENFLDGGFTYLFGPNFQVDARFGVQLEGEGPRYFTGVGLAARL